MKCPKCGHLEDRVIDSRASNEGASVRRRRECVGCGARFTTSEDVVPAEIYVIKRDDTREEFNPQKIRNGVLRALWKRPVREPEVDALIGRVMTRIEALQEREVSSETIGEIVVQELERLDPVACVRFASVYRQFEDLEAFIRQIRSLDREQR